MNEILSPMSTEIDSLPVIGVRSTNRRSIRALWIILAIIAATTAALALTIAFNHDWTEVQVKQLELSWRIVASIGAIVGTGLGWLIKHQSDVVLTRLRLEYEQSLAEATLKANRVTRRIDTIVQAQVNAVIQERLLTQKTAQEKELEEHRQDLELIYRRKTLDLEALIANEKKQRLIEATSLEDLSTAISNVQTSFRILTKAGPSFIKEDLDRRINIALAAKSELETSIQAVKKSFRVMSDGFTSLHRNLDRTLLGIIKQMREYPSVDEVNDEDMAAIAKEYERIGRPAMQRHGAHLRTITSYLIVAVEHELNPTRFQEIRITQERNVHALTLMRILRRNIVKKSGRESP